MKKFISIFFVFCLALMCLTPVSFGQSTVNNTFQTKNSSQNQLYWLKSPNGNFIFEGGNLNKPNTKCKITYGKKYASRYLKNSPVIAMPKADWYFKGFANSKGSSLKVKTKNYSLLQIKVHGVTYYDYFPAKDSSLYKYLPLVTYNSLVKKHIKGIYGTTSFKVKGSFCGYFPDSKQPVINAIFKEKSSPKLKVPSSVSKEYGIASSLGLIDAAGIDNISFRSSNPKVCKIDKESGRITVIGQGISTITTTLSPTQRVKGKTYQTKVKIMPPQISVRSVVRKTMASADLSWSKDKNASGYQILLSKSSGFTKCQKYTINSTKKTSHTIKDLKKNTRYYIKVRAYKKSCGETLNGKWSKPVTVKL